MTIRKTIYQTSDGAVFDSADDAERYERKLALEEFFTGKGMDVAADPVATAILDNLDAFGDIIRPMIKQRRTVLKGENDDKFHV